MTRINLNQYKEDQRANALVVETDDGDFTILPPQLWAEDAADLAEDDVRGFAAVALGGVDELERFIAAGGSAVMVGALFKDHYGNVGESSASSSSSASTPRPSKRTSSGSTGSASRKNLGHRG